jgi:hypothetical protein
MEGSQGPDRTPDPPPRQRGLLSAIAIVAIAIIAGIITLTDEKRIARSVTGTDGAVIWP